MKINVPDEHALLLLCISDAMDHARQKHPQGYVDAHHALGVMTEEFDEFKAVVAMRRLNKRRLEAEALDIAAVAARTVLDLCVDPRFKTVFDNLEAERKGGNR